MSAVAPRIVHDVSYVSWIMRDIFPGRRTIFGEVGG